MLPLIDVTAEGAGGLQVVPNTNNDICQQDLVERYPGTKGSSSDWVELRNNDPLMGTGQLV